MKNTEEKSIQETAGSENKDHDTETKTAKKPKRAVEKRVTIKLPLTKTEREDVIVGLNGKNYQIKRGVPVEVPEGVAEILQHQEEMLAKIMEFEEEAAAKVEELEKR